MILKRLLCCAYLSVLALAFSHTSSAQNSLKLLPAPKEVKMAEGSFVVTSGTRIVIEANYADEDQNAAEILAQEVFDQSGLRVPSKLRGRRSRGRVRSYWAAWQTRGFGRTSTVGA